MARQPHASLVAQLRDLQVLIMVLECAPLDWHRSSETSRRLESIPGVGLITATALAAKVTDSAYSQSG